MIQLIEKSKLSVCRLEQRGGIELTLSAVYLHPSIGVLRELLYQGLLLLCDSSQFNTPWKTLKLSRSVSQLTNIELLFSFHYNVFSQYIYSILGQGLVFCREVPCYQRTSSQGDFYSN